VAAEDQNERRIWKDRRSGGERRRPRSSFVERIGKALGRRSGNDRRSDGERRAKD